MKKLFAIITLITLLGSQVFGAALCPSICFGLDSQVTSPSTTPSCHQNTQAEDSVPEMPENCELMTMLDILSTFNLSTTLDISKPKIQFLELGVLNPPMPKINYLSINQSTDYSQYSLNRIYPLYILNQSFLI